MNSAIEMKDIAFSYGAKKVLSDFNLHIKEGKVYGLVGSSGSGKTTTLRLMNGLLKPNSGQIKIDGQIFDFTQAEKWRRSMGYSIQGSGLFPHMTLLENLTIIARKEGWKSKEITQRVGELCELMSLPLDRNFLNKKPRQISGGQQQRVGIARALFMNPKIMLMDEPFSALDPITRSELQKEFLSLQEKLNITIVLVTHDLPEAFSMSHEIVLLNQGKIEQKDRPSKFLLSPATPYVEEFMNSHSPGNILKEVYLYSVVNSNLYASIQADNHVILKHLETSEKKEFSNTEQASNFLKENNQIAHYWVEPDWNYRERSDFNGNLSDKSLYGKTHILDGMKALLNSRQQTLPVINDKGKLIGVFSQEALDAL